ncbi:fused rhodanese domain-containing protein/hydrolase [Haloferax mucosum ATCC BAA-1512]|uniref:Fused rhodanese domain-containing protein/hydrolase n=1 Tax=Haloferax mucosum ATCC BAA-1512 TaxID=662479 RepID=M0I6X1_9EURY|nr:MBL fold metallo-hydrolase [Haloferax mucosum]ELZ91194.1 fused rhodanese domain-containing protein/hydrolase [Haloferax mucosum ATCC BAA-1512]
MTAPDLPELDIESPVIEPEALKSRIDGGEALTILDNRVPSEHEKWRIDGENVSHINIPYFEFLDDDLDESLFENLPEDEEFVVLCAKGHSSEYVAGVLIEEGYDAVALERGMNGWAGIYEYTELETDGDALVAQYQRPSSGCLAYLVVDGDEAAVIDPLRYFTDEYVADAKALGADLTYAIDTHIHADHISGVRTLVEDAGVTGVIPEAAEARGVEYDVAYETIGDGDVVTVGDTEIEAIHTPGHTTGMTTYKVDNVLFTGDGLFIESVARPDLEDGDEGAPDAAGMLYDTLQQRVLPHEDDTIVASAHFSDAATPASDGSYTATLGELEATMDALHMDRDEFVEFILSDMPPRPANYIDIIETNLGVQESDDDRAFELELGPNNCAASNEALTN